MDLVQGEAVVGKGLEGVLVGRLIGLGKLVTKLCGGVVGGPGLYTFTC